MEVEYIAIDEEGTPLKKAPKDLKGHWNWELATKIADLTMPGGWYGGSVNQGEWLKSCSAVVKGYTIKTGPKAGATYPPRTPELVWETVQAMWMDVFPDFKREYFKNVYSVNTGSPSFIERVARGEHIPPPCPMWHEQDYQKWQSRWGDSYVKFHSDYQPTLDEWRRFH